MMRHGRVCLSFALLAAAAGGCLAGGRGSFVWDVADVRLSRVGPDSVRAELVVRVHENVLSRNERRVLRPFVCVGDRSYDFPEALPSGGVVDCAFETVFPGFGSDDSVEVHVSWSHQKMRGFSCRELFFHSQIVALFVPQRCPEFSPDYPLLYVDDAGACERTVVVPLQLSFAEGGNVYDASLEENAACMEEFVGAVKPFVASPWTKVSRIAFSSYTDIAGPSGANASRARSRLGSVYSCLRRDGVFARKSVILNAAGEDWNGLVSWFNGTAWADDAALSAVMADMSVSEDVRERKLKAFGPFWEYLSAQVFPSLNRFECEMRYTLVPYGDNLQRMASFRQDGRLLSPYDYSSLLRAGELWSEQWCGLVYAFAAEYPWCHQAQVDACALSLYRGDLKDASERFRYMNADDDYARYYRALWLMYMGLYDEAYEAVSGLDTGVFHASVNQIALIHSWRHRRSPWYRTLFPVEG